MLTPLYPIANTPATITVVAPGAFAAATSVPVSPITIALPVGYRIKFGTDRFAELTAAAAIGAAALNVAALGLAITAGLTATVLGSKASLLLHDTFVGYAPEKQRATELVVEGLLGLTAGYVGDDAEWLAFAKVLQINFMIERGDESLVKKSIVRGSPSQSEVYRDRSINPDAAIIVARVTGRQQVRFTPPFASV